MAEMNKIKSFKSFSDILAQESAAKLAEENNLKRAELSTKIASILDSMNITSLEGLEEDQKTEIISQLFGEISEEETEEDVPVVNDEEEVEELTEAIKVEGKRDAKKVLTVYNKIFNKVLVDLGAMPNDSILGCIKYLMSEAMIDANFHREAASVSKMIKGNIKPLEIKMPGLGGHFIKIGPTTIKSILDKYYSDVANAAGWSGMGIAEGTALYLEQIKQEAMGQAVINKFNSAFEGADVRIDLDSKLNESKDSSTVTVSDETTKLEERNAFLGARAKAIEEDLEEFEFNGKMYPVTVNESTVLNEGTRGQFGKIDKAGNITSVYTHYDSYPENMLPIIKKSFKGGKNVDNVIDKGANSGLDADISKINFYNDGTTNTTGSIKNIDNYLKDADRDGGAEFVYLWDEKSKKWMMADIYGGSGLVPAFESVVTEAKFVKDFNRDVLNAKTKEEVLELYPNAEFFIGKSDHFFGEFDENLFFKAYYTKGQKEFEIKSVYSEKGSNYVHLYNESVVTENYEVIYSDGVSAMKKFRNEKQALDFMKKEIASNKKLRDIAVYKPGMHSTTQTELVVKFWGDGSYLDNVSKRDEDLAAKKLEEGNAFGAARAEAIAKGEKEFKVDGETFKVEDVDTEDKENAEEFVEESKITLDSLVEMFTEKETVTEDLRSDVKKFIKQNNKELDELADQDQWDMMYQKLYDEFEVEADSTKGKDLLKTFQFVY